MWPFKKKAPDQTPEARVLLSQPAQAVQKDFFGRRSFNSAKTDRITGNWTNTPQPINGVLQRNLRTLRARSREQYINNDYALRFVNIVKRGVLGSTGFSLKSIPQNLDGTTDRDAAIAIEKAFKDWGKKNHCDYSGRNSFKKIQDLILSSIIIDGEAIVRKVIGQGKYNYQIMLYDAELLDVTNNQTDRNGTYIKMGVECDSNSHKPLYYHFLATEGSQDSYERSGKRYNRVPASEICHIFVPEFIGQLRGIPWMSRALFRLMILGRYEDAALVAAESGAENLGFLIPKSGEISEEYKGDGVDENGETVYKSEAGSMETLPPGYDVKAFNPNYPHQQYEMYMKQVLRGIASGLDITYNRFGNDLQGVSFSSMRSGEIEDRDIFRCIQNWLSDDLMTWIFDQEEETSWLKMALLSSQIKIGKTALKLSKIEKYRQARFFGRAWEWSDILKENKAKDTAIKNRTLSRSEIIRERGLEPNEVFDEIAAEEAYLRSKGVEPNAEAITTDQSDQGTSPGGNQISIDDSGDDD